VICILFIGIKYAVRLWVIENEHLVERVKRREHPVVFFRLRELRSPINSSHPLHPLRLQRRLHPPYPLPYIRYIRYIRCVGYIHSTRYIRYIRSSLKPEP
jgi:hypothetical protein